MLMYTDHITLKKQWMNIIIYQVRFHRQIRTRYLIQH